MGRAARRKETGRCTRQLCIPRITVRTQQPSGQRRGTGQAGRGNTGQLPREAAVRHGGNRAIPHRNRTGGTGCRGGALLRHQGRSGMGQHSLHTGARRTGPADTRRLLRLAGTEKHRFARDHTPLPRRHARRTRNAEDIRHQPATEFLYKGDTVRVVPQVQRAED